MSPVHVVVISIVPCATRSKRLFSLIGFIEKMDSLSFLDLSNNNIQRIEGLPSKAKVILSLNHRPLDFAPGVLTEAHCLSLQKRTIPNQLFFSRRHCVHMLQKIQKVHQVIFSLPLQAIFSKSASHISQFLQIIFHR